MHACRSTLEDPTSYELDLGYRFYLTDRWFLKAQGNYAFNRLTGSGQRLLESDQVLPDVAFMKYRASLQAGFNLFYGKFRLTMDQVFYFDQYVSIGPAWVRTHLDGEPALAAEAGLAFWIGRRASLRIGVQDYLFREVRKKSASVANHLLVHMDLGILFGGGV